MSRSDIRHIFVGPTGRRTGQNIEYFVDDKELTEIFNKYGVVTAVKVRSNAKDVFAFIHFETHEGAGRAIEKLNGFTIHNTKIKVDWGAYNGYKNNHQNSHHQQQQHRDSQPARQHIINSRSNQYNSDTHGSGSRTSRYESYNEPRTVRYEPRVDHSRSNVANRHDSYRDNRGRRNSYSPRRRSYSPQQRRRERVPMMYGRNDLSRSHSPRDIRRDSISQRRTENISPRGRSRGRREERIYRLTLEDIPPEMEWEDLREIGKKYGGMESVVSGRTWVDKGMNVGYIDFDRQQSQQATYNSLKGHRINGHKIHLILER